MSTQDLLEITTIKAGDEVSFPKVGNLVRVHFTAYLATGEKVESSKSIDIINVKILILQ